MSWRHRAEEVAYRLRYYGDDGELEDLIVSVVAQLPEDVAEFALERCAFLSIGRANCGMVLPGRIGSARADYRGLPENRSPAGEPWLVLLAEDLPELDASGIVAHEIAHAWLGHDRLSLIGHDTRSLIGPEVEIETARLVAAWGFTGIGADEDHYHRVRGGGTEAEM